MRRFYPAGAARPVDCGLAEDAGLALAPYPHLRAWIERVQAQPGFLAQVHPYPDDPYSVREL